MKIFTTYYSNLRNVKDIDNIIIVSISRTYPQFVNPDIHYVNVAPTPYMIGVFKRESKENVKLAIVHYITEYKKILKNNNFDANEFLKDFYTKHKNNIILLCCYESPKSFCHRHLLSEYIKNISGYDIKELKTTKEEIIEQLKNTKEYVY